MKESPRDRYKKEQLPGTVALPCPWCGTVPVIQFWHGGGPRKRLVSCPSEDCAIAPSVTGTTRARAIEAWNHRPGDPDNAADLARIRGLTA